jgi:peptide/nickel transport system permease protein
MFLASIAVFIITESSPGNVARNILGPFITPEQEASFLAQTGLDKPAVLKYLYWLLGSDWHGSRKVGLPLKRITTIEGFDEWWAVREDGVLVRWKLSGEDLVAVVRRENDNIVEQKDNDRWKIFQDNIAIFWGVDFHNHVVKWEKGSAKTTWTFVKEVGWKESTGAPVEYIPLKKGFIRGDPGISLRTGRPVSKIFFARFKNSMILAGIAFVIVMPLALFFGLIAGLKEGTFSDNVLSIGGMTFTVIPEFATGIFLTLILAVWLDVVPGAVVFRDAAPWEQLDMLILPIMTLTLGEFGYVLRITRASVVEVMQSTYIRTAFLKGLPYWRVVMKHVIRNALIAPITVIMLHVNWLLGGIVVVEMVFSYPGLGRYLLNSALYKDVNALEAGAMLLVVVAVGTQLIADIIYTFLNPRIRYN